LFLDYRSADGKSAFDTAGFLAVNSITIKEKVVALNFSFWA